MLKDTAKIKNCRSKTGLFVNEVQYTILILSIFSESLVSLRHKTDYHETRLQKI